jgi:indole-3-glycerol phosphate synthase
MKAEGPWIDRILARTRPELEARKRRKALPLLRTFARAAPKPPPFEAALRRAPADGSAPARIVARLERKNPARGLFAAGLDAQRAAADWEAGGAGALACWNDAPFFAGAADDAARLRTGPRLPLLLCDFVFDEYPLAEARVAGASAVLLFEEVAGAALPALLRAARDLGLECPVEVRDEAALGRALDAGAAMISLGARDLATFATDEAPVLALAPRAAKSGVLVIAADAAATPDDVRRQREAGVEAWIVGGPLIDTADRRAAMRALAGA